MCANTRVTRGLMDAIGVTITTLDIDKAVNRLMTPRADASPQNIINIKPVFAVEIALIAPRPPIGANNNIPKNMAAAAIRNGDPYDSYKSLFERLLKLPEDTYIYPAHDYKGESVSTIGEEKKFNPRLQVSSAQEYAYIMNNLNLDNPKQMDIVIPKNISMGISIEKQKKLNGILFEELKDIILNKNCQLIDLREKSEISTLPSLNNSINVPYLNLHKYINSKKIELSKIKLIFYCAVGERSALAVQICSSYNLKNVCHLMGGIKSVKNHQNPGKK